MKCLESMEPNKQSNEVDLIGVDVCYFHFHLIYTAFNLTSNIWHPAATWTSSFHFLFPSNHQVRFISLITQVMLIDYVVSYSSNEITNFPGMWDWLASLLEWLGLLIKLFREAFLGLRSKLHQHSSSWTTFLFIMQHESDSFECVFLSG